MVLRLRNIARWKGRPAAFEDGISEYAVQCPCLSQDSKGGTDNRRYGSDRKYSQTSHSRSVILSGI